MADISDVTAFLSASATAAVYPNGVGVKNSVAGCDVRVFEGWPQPDQLDLDMAGKMLVNGMPQPRQNGAVANVSIFPMLGTTLIPYQILDNTYLITNVSYGMSFTVNGNVITVTGSPSAGEYLTIVADRAHVYSSNASSTAAILAALATAASANYSGVSYTGNTLTIPYGFSLSVRQGGVATLGKVVHRERQSIMVTVWAPTHAIRSSLASAIDIYIKSNIRVSMPDTSQAIITYNRTNVIDDQQVATIYRRDLIYDCEYATVQQFPGYVITSVNTTIYDVVPPNPQVVAVT